eukprot:3829058-Pyramimonas_sp.AAC.1
MTCGICATRWEFLTRTVLVRTSDIWENIMAPGKRDAHAWARGFWLISQKPLAERLPPLTRYKNPSQLRFAFAFGSPWRSGPLAALEVEAAAASPILDRLPAIISASSQAASNGRVQ